MRLGWLLVGIVALLFFMDYIGPTGIVHIISRVNPIAIVLLVLVELVGFALYGTTWYVLIRSAMLPSLKCPSSK